VDDRLVTGGILVLVVGVALAALRRRPRPRQPKATPAHHSHRLVDGRWHNYSTSGSGPYK
jgi:hypothetical protein